jgi:hypothetical protein
MEEAAVVTVGMAVLVTCIGCFAIKAVGFIAPQRVLDHPAVQRMATLLPVTLLAALAAQQTVTHGRSFSLDARLPAMVVAAVALRFRAPFLVVVVVAAATAALLRAV